MQEKQRTLTATVSLSGKGLHTGQQATITLLPAAENTGIQFKRTDLEGSPIVKALAENVVETSRSTTIKTAEAKVTTIEHLMAAFYACGIDNALVEINAPEVPILDGSAKPFLEAILSVGTTEQAAEREYYCVTEKITFSIPETGSEITLYPDTEFSADVNIDFNSSVVGVQHAGYKETTDFATDFSACRTFVFLHEILPLLENNLIKGGDLENAIVIVEKPVSAEHQEKFRAITGKDYTMTAGTYLTPIRFSNEIARHKLVDLLGDLYLCGKRIKGKIVASRPGHFANTEFAKIVRRQMKKDATKPEITYNPNDTPVYDINQVRDILPHRPPFLLVDKITHITQDSIVGIKNVTMNEPFFVGHFPEEPVMPGVLIIEAMAQCGGVLALNTVDDPKTYSTYFMKIDGVKFKRKVVPGDTLQFILHLSEPIRRGIVIMEAKAYVADTLAVEAVLTAQIVKNKQ